MALIMAVVPGNGRWEVIEKILAELEGYVRAFLHEEEIMEGAEMDSARGKGKGRGKGEKAEANGDREEGEEGKEEDREASRKKRRRLTTPPSSPKNCELLPLHHQKSLTRSQFLQRPHPSASPKTTLTWQTPHYRSKTY